MKLSVAVNRPERPFWQKRYYDFNVFTMDKWSIGTVEIESEMTAARRDWGLVEPTSQKRDVGHPA